MLRGSLFGFCAVVSIFGAIYLVSDRVAPEPWKRFSNSYISFNLPPGWDCVSDETGFVCERANGDKKGRALFVLAAKYVGPTDNFEYYRTYLETPKPLDTMDSEEPAPSVVEQVELRKTSGQDWLFAQHFNTLLPDYHSQYFTTIRKDLAILVTYSYHKDAPRRLHSIGEQAARSFIVLN